MALFGRETAHDQRRAQAWREWFIRQHPLALTALVLSVFSLTHLGTLFVDELAGIVLGTLAIRATWRGGDSRNAGIAYAAIVIGVISLSVAIILYTRQPV
jgi:hypothetical protein